ncbi:TetR family transcriptional regulator [Kurthia sibirica]|uniref:Uncharacterized protein n=1 Tax=Kurthia sibirica TaxID=202750 RepID=A0A2U3AIX8_9BACL|nr:TetR family transcriptional regulator [Kurthia sibirica]PWI24506.1 hypothetical protein DEX24_13010 [Kurthia sibirica]GEK33570.1 TetR family transcriptional regulator [Kurthia sibirica]
MKLTDIKLTRTKLQLWNALCELLFNEKREFDTLTINDICQQAFVHRSTFYNHFSDKFHLFQFGYELTLSKKSGFSTASRLLSPFETIVNVNEQLMFPILLHSYPNSLKPLIHEAQKKEITMNLTLLLEKNYDLKLPLEITADLLTSVYTALSNYVISNKMSAQEADHSFRLFIKGGLITEL